MKKKYGIVSYNLHCNFTNYGSALQQYALHRVVNELAPDEIESIIMDYCPDCLAEKDVLNPYKNMWDQDEESLNNAKKTLPAIKENWAKFNHFFETQYVLSNHKYTPKNFELSKEQEGLTGYICGSDTIWCIDEFCGFEPGYFAEFDVMKNASIAYAASFGDAKFEGDNLILLKQRMHNYRAIGVREDTNLALIKQECPNIMVQRVLDPTLLLTGKDYEPIIADKQLDEPYILLYTRRFNQEMENYAINLAKKCKCKIVEISLRAINQEKGHIMRYDAGVEEFLSLIKHAEYVVTNSFHGAIFAIQLHKEFSIFSRQECDTKIDELLNLLGLSERKFVAASDEALQKINYDNVEACLQQARKESLQFLQEALK